MRKCSGADFDLRGLWLRGWLGLAGSDAHPCFPIPGTRSPLVCISLFAFSSDSDASLFAQKVLLIMGVKAHLKRLAERSSGSKAHQALLAEQFEFMALQQRKGAQRAPQQPDATLHRGN